VDRHKVICEIISTPNEDVPGQLARLLQVV